MENNKKPIKKKAELCFCTTPHYGEPCAEYKHSNPMRYYNIATYLNNHRIAGPSDYDGVILHTGKVDVKKILKALQIPESIINQIKFENE